VGNDEESNQLSLHDDLQFEHEALSQHQLNVYNYNRTKIYESRRCGKSFIGIAFKVLLLYARSVTSRVPLKRGA
jgi:hypothetical protein